MMLRSTRRPKNIKGNGGFTLIELIVYSALLSVLLLVLTDLLITVLEIKLESEANSSIRRAGSYAVLRLNYDIQRARSIIEPAAQQALAHELILDISGENYHYKLVSGKLVLTNNLGTFELNGSDTQLTNLSFLKVGGSSVKIDMDFKSVARSKTGFKSLTFSTSSGIRK